MKTLWKVLVAAGVATVAHSAWSQYGPTELAAMSPWQRMHALKAQAARRANQPSYNYDIRPAQLVSYRLTESVDASKVFATAALEFVARDNLSGVAQAYATLQSPGGSWTTALWEPGFPATRTSGALSFSLSETTETGTWTVVELTVVDANGNAGSYDAAALAAMGRNTVEVAGVAGDVQAPTLVGRGVNTTPTVSLQRPPLGTLPGTAARVGVILKAQDLGTSGLSYAYVTFCQANGYTCLYLYPGTPPARGTLRADLSVGGTASTWTALGSYALYNVELRDHAGNYSAIRAPDPRLRQVLDVSTIEVVE